MTKVVNIYPKSPIVSLNPPIRFPAKGVTRTTADIYKCIIARAIVDEVLSDGSTVRLTFANYDKDNEPKIKAIPEVEEETPAIESTIAEDAKEEVLEQSKEIIEEAPVVASGPVFNKEYTRHGRRNKKKNQPQIIGEVKALESEPEELEAIDFDELNIETTDVESL